MCVCAQGLVDCLRKLVKAGGLRSVYTGLSASITGIIPYSGVDLTVYSLLRDVYEEHYPDKTPGVAVSLACGAWCMLPAAVRCKYLPPCHALTALLALPWRCRWCRDDVWPTRGVPASAGADAAASTGHAWPPGRVRWYDRLLLANVAI